MNRSTRSWLRRFASFGLSILLAVPAAMAASHTEDPLALLPGNAASVGVIRWSELRNSPLAARVFSSMDGLTADGDGARFLRETELSPREDIDTMVPGVGGVPAYALNEPASRPKTSKRRNFI